MDIIIKFTVSVQGNVHPKEVAEAVAAILDRNSFPYAKPLSVQSWERTGTVCTSDISVIELGTGRA